LPIKRPMGYGFTSFSTIFYMNPSACHLTIFIYVLPSRLGVPSFVRLPWRNFLPPPFGRGRVAPNNGPTPSFLISNKFIVCICTDNFDNISNSSVLSAWSLNDDVKRILYGSKTKPRPSKVKSQVTFEVESNDRRSVDLESRGTASLLDNMDWQAVDALIASVDDASD